jgi:hypothetical protein
MPLLRHLTKDEQRALIHKIRNSGRSKTDPTSGEILDNLMSQDFEKELAKVSEVENYNLKNRYRFQKTQMDYADKKRMPIDQSKVKDILRN